MSTATCRTASLAALALVFAHSAWAQRTPRDVQIVPADARLRVGERAPFLATAYDAAGNPIDSVAFVWSSSNPDVATIDQAGIATGVSVGLAIITVRTGSGASAKSAQTPVQVAGEAAAPVVPQAAASARTAAPPAPSPPALTHADSLRRDCDGGNATSCTDLSVLYFRGVGVPRDLGEARVLSERGCDGGNAHGCRNLGVLYEHGTGATQDFGQARALYQRACDHGDAAGCNDLGVLYQYARGVARDLGQARDFLQRGCDGGYAPSCTNLGVLLGHLSTPDHALERTLYQRGCDAGDPHGCTNLGVTYELGLGTTIDAAQARAWYQRGCDRGDADGCDKLRRLR